MPSQIVRKYLDNGRESGMNMALMLDYDGTLAPIVQNPQDAFIPSGHIDLLCQLSRLPDLHLAIVSGRSVVQLKNFLCPLMSEKNLIFCGLHGGEVYLPADDMFLLRPSQNETLILIENFIRNFRDRWVHKTEGFQGITLEEKGYSLAMHYRGVHADIRSRAIEAFVDTMNDHPALCQFFRIQAGKEVLEILPKSFSKGKAVHFLLKYWQQTYPDRRFSPCYIGDDITDEAAYEVVNAKGGLTIYVGSAVAATCAQEALAAPEQVYEALRHILV